MNFWSLIAKVRLARVDPKVLHLTPIHKGRKSCNREVKVCIYEKIDVLGSGTETICAKAP